MICRGDPCWKELKGGKGGFIIIASVNLIRIWRYRVKHTWKHYGKISWTVDAFHLTALVLCFVCFFFCGLSLKNVISFGCICNFSEVLSMFVWCENVTRHIISHRLEAGSRRVVEGCQLSNTLCSSIHLSRWWYRICVCGAHVNPFSTSVSDQTLLTVFCFVF